MSAPSASTIAEALNGRPSGSGYVCECPAHVDLRPSLSVTQRDGRVLVHCHAGCTQSAVIGALRRQGLWGDAIVLGSKPIAGVADTTDALDASLPYSLGATGRDPMRSWRNALPFFHGCVADRALRHRGIELTDEEAHSLRFSPSLWHWPSADTVASDAGAGDVGRGRRARPRTRPFSRPTVAPRRRSATRPDCSSPAADGRAAGCGSAVRIRTTSSSSAKEIESLLCALQASRRYGWRRGVVGRRGPSVGLAARREEDPHFRRSRRQGTRPRRGAGGEAALDL